MNLKQTNQSSGSILLVTMVFVLTIAAIMISYLSLVQNSNQAITRSQTWNGALTVAESGVEETMAHLNSGAGLAENGWGQTGTNYGPITRPFSGGTYSAYFIPGANRIATIFSTGTLPTPITANPVSRSLKVIAQKQSLFSVGLGAVYQITGNGNGIASSSWDSHDPIQSTNGLYNGYLGDNGDVASQQGLVNIGSHTVQGDLYLGPDANVTDKGTVTGSIYSDWNVRFPDVVLPTTDTNGFTITWTPAPVGTNGTTKTSTLVHRFTTSGYYRVDDSLPIEVDAGVTVTLRITPSTWNATEMTIKGGMTNAGTVIAYQERGTANLDLGKAVLPNYRPENFFYFGLPAVTTINMGGATYFIGAIYAPEADIKLNGGGAENNIMGSLVGRSVTINGHYNIHYDLALAFYYDRGYVVVHWQEIY